MAISAKLRAKTETLKGGRFPMPDKKHARLALQDLPKAKGLSEGAEDKIENRAHKMLGTPNTEADDKPKPTPFKKRM